MGVFTERELHGAGGARMFWAMWSTSAMATMGTTAGGMQLSEGTVRV